MTNTQDKNRGDLAGFAPEEINGWKAAQEDIIYDEITIFDYIDGAGEVYRAYQFKKLRARHFTKPESPDILVDLFDMGSSRNAYGVFTHNLEGERVGIGQGSTYESGLLSFWKGRYFVSLYAERETPESEKTVLELGRIISSRIPDKGPIPEIVSLLPEKGLDQSKVRYFYNPLILNYHFFISEGNLFQLNPETDAVLGAYGEEESRFWLLLVHYPDKKKARKVYRDFLRTYMPDSPPDLSMVRTENGKWTAAEIQEKRLAIVFEAPAKDKALKLLASIEDKI